jgi:anti-sigma regulatory factor (Ser/Thr protein kinase)
MNTALAVAVRIRRTEQLHLAALVSSVGCSRLMVRQICISWQLEQDLIDIAELATSELVSNAVTASGVSGPRSVPGAAFAGVKLVGVRLLELADSLVIEVWDTSPRLPELIQAMDLMEHGRGLQLVDALSIRWGHYAVRTGGKVVFCQLALDDDARAQDADDAEGQQIMRDALQARRDSRDQCR